MPQARSRQMAIEDTVDIEELRKQYLSEVEVEAAAASSPAVAPAALESHAMAAQHEPEAVRDMVTALPLDEEAYEASVRTLLDILGNDALDPAPRLSALNTLGAAEFQPAAFAPFHAEFIELLRRLALHRSKDIRTAALERLTLTNDPEAQRLLREGLEKIRRPLVTAAKAVQLLARDDHGSAIPLFRRLAANATGQVREQALRALAVDPKSIPLFEEIAANKQERTQLRQIAAVNLKNTSASRFAKLARDLVLDEQEVDKLRAVAVSAIAHTSDVAARLKSPAFTESVLALGASTGSRALKASVARLSKTLGDTKA
ncbi:hypothetical protein [Methylobacterium nonmethylotrophicum]|uniref:Importin N-terminal domain-containing protein n=1 Tax=Methylobacterium nonmethylotrophicum TaxID=1141884 RepID=A0A4Z0NUJ2_9HYPH|nr:hypothetical protein [Methylobacterium nonmethylotrophicum]TGE00817.1 hypothetical protein EU555_08750 [Methylobacterium nonmethylotrophicum]